MKFKWALKLVCYNEGEIYPTISKEAVSQFLHILLSGLLYETFLLAGKHTDCVDINFIIYYILILI